MTRLRKGPSIAELRHEYIFTDPPPSLSDLAEKYGLARSGIADKARIGKWFEEREKFRSEVTDGVRGALAEKWVDFQTANYERLMKMAGTYLDQYQTALETGEIKVNTRDMLGIAAMMRVFLGDMTKVPLDALTDVTPGDFGSEAEAREAIEMVRRLTAGGGDAGTDPTEQGHAGGDAAPGTKDPRAN